MHEPEDSICKVLFEAGKPLSQAEIKTAMCPHLGPTKEEQKLASFLTSGMDKALINLVRRNDIICDMSTYPHRYTIGPNLIK